MTDISTEPVAVTTPPPAPPIEQPAATAPAAATGGKTPAVEHTAGGWPVVPLATTGANSAVSGLAAAALAGGPAGIATAVAGLAVVSGTVLARRAIRNRTAKTTVRAGGKSVPTPRTSRQNTPGTRSGSNPSTGTKRGSGSSSRSGKSPLGKGRSAGSTAAGTSSARSGKASGRVGQVKALRQAASKSAPTRAERRAQNTQARRQAADSRRNTPAARHSNTSGPTRDATGRTSGGTAPKSRRQGGNGGSGRSSSWLGGKVRAGRDAAVRRVRAARDRQAAQAVDASRGKVRAAATAKQARAAKRVVRKEARRQLWRSAARKQGRRLLAALLAAPLGALGMLTTPLGRQLGIQSIQHPGRRLYRRLMRTAEEQQAARDAAIREQREAAEAAIDTELSEDVQQIGGTVERPFHLTPASPSSPVEVVNVSGFKFEEAAAEMENAARTYEPDNAMEILAMVENLPDALTSVANTFRILAERSDSEFPLEKDIAGAFDEIYGALMRAVESSGDLGPLFQQVHEHDIARHTDPRNGPEAEKGWNV
ncbi:hypothetical protein ACPB9E_05190 [Streptomyces exfoliatus]|uniref:hypothetical protein n=1 Tax=Streptomyces exfoliatus TaxID=1905 RepID=UPI003C2D5A53